MVMLFMLFKFTTEPKCFLGWTCFYIQYERFHDDFVRTKLKNIYLQPFFKIYLAQFQLQNALSTLVNFDLTINFTIKLNAKNIWDPILLIVLSWNPKSEIKLAIGMLWIYSNRAVGAVWGQNPPSQDIVRYVYHRVAIPNAHY